MSRALIKTVIIQSPFGVPFFVHQVDDVENNSPVDGILVGGMSSAVSSMWADFVDNDTMGFEIMERSGTTITAHKTELSTMVIISKKRFPQLDLNRLERIHNQIERDYPDIEKGNKSGIINKLPDDEIINIFRNNNIMF